MFCFCIGSLTCRCPHQCKFCCVPVMGVRSKTNSCHLLPCLFTGVDRLWHPLFTQTTWCMPWRDKPVYVPFDVYAAATAPSVNTLVHKWFPFVGIASRRKVEHLSSLCFCFYCALCEPLLSQLPFVWRHVVCVYKESSSTHIGRLYITHFTAQISYTCLGSCTFSFVVCFIQLLCPRIVFRKPKRARYASGKNIRCFELHDLDPCCQSGIGMQENSLE